MHWLLKSFDNETENSLINLFKRYQVSSIYNTILIFQDGKEFASNNGLMFTEVSAKTGMNVDDVFTNLGQYIHCTVQLNIHTNNTYLQIHTYTL